MSEENKPGCLWPAAWLILGFLGTVIAGVAVGLSAADSESAGVLATQAVAFPVGALWSGGLVALIVHFMKSGKGVRFGAPIGCGCLGGIIMVALVVVFFVGIFPSL
jgi:hypothetical protein